MNQKMIDYIAGWIVQEVEHYHGTTIHDMDVDTPEAEWPIKEWSELNQEILSKMIERAVEAWDGGARDE